MTQREKTMVSFLGVTVFATGICLLILGQVNQYYREKVWADLDTTMPKHEIKVRAATTTPKSVIKTPETEGWKTYKNEQYGFELKFPPSWATMKVKDRGLSFYLPYADTKEYFFICGIQQYSQKQWDDLQSSEGPHPTDIIGTDADGYIYTYVCGGDDYGYAGFEEYNQQIKNHNYMVGNETVMGPIQQFSKLVIPTFKFTPVPSGTRQAK